MNRIILISILLVGSQVYAAEVYMSVDENGNPVFSDKPSDEAEKINVRDIITIPAIENTKPPASAPEPVERYVTLSISNPKNDETYFRSEGDLAINVQVSPRIRGGDKVIYYLDGKPVHTSGATSFSIAEMDRGTHSVSVSIVGLDGEVVKTSAPVTFHMRQASAIGR